jgi:GT2 family glycosyltransferase
LKLSVVLVNYKVPLFLHQALLSLRHALQGIEAEVWVVDNASGDNSIDRIRQYFPEVRLIANTENVGFSRANNQAMRESSAEYILLLNPDTLLPEDSIHRSLEFMDRHPQAGGLGIRMLDGSGRFLPESKRDLPTPLVALWKLIGLSTIFPRSRRFGRYHLGYLSAQQNHPVHVLCGAFMLMRRSVLQEVGLLDERYFMYGEDIDLSHRIRLAGYENWYFSETPILHYKGESTQKQSMRYVRLFYQAMALFAHQHFSPQGARLLGWLLYVGIGIRALAALSRRWSRRALHPILDAALLYGVMVGLTHWWQTYIKADEGVVYPPIFLQWILPCYVLLWIGGLYLSGAYERPYRSGRLVGGLLAGSIAIAGLYAFLPVDLRFSRGLILAGTLCNLLFAAGLHGALERFSGHTKLRRSHRRLPHLLIAGDKAAVDRTRTLLQAVSVPHHYLGYVSPTAQPFSPSIENILNSHNSLGKIQASRNKTSEEARSEEAWTEEAWTEEARQGESVDHDYLGSDLQLCAICDALEADELILCGDTYTNKQMITWIEALGSMVPSIKILPEGADFIMGSSSVDHPGTIYSSHPEMRITRAEQQRKKRLFDLLVALVLLFFWPLLGWWHYPQTLRSIPSLWGVLAGRLSLISFPHTDHLPKMKAGLISIDSRGGGGHIGAPVHYRLRSDYCRHYSIGLDLSRLISEFRTKTK